MSREAIKDNHFRTIGYIERLANGEQKALNRNFLTLGYYNPRRNVTQDTHFRTLTIGNTLASLITGY